MIVTMISRSCFKQARLGFVALLEPNEYTNARRTHLKVHELSRQRYMTHGQFSQLVDAFDDEIDATAAGVIATRRIVAEASADTEHELVHNVRGFRESPSFLDPKLLSRRADVAYEHVSNNCPNDEVVATVSADLARRSCTSVAQRFAT